MNGSATKYILLLLAAASVFIAVNLTVYAGSWSGTIAPIESIMMWGAFAAFSVFVLLWAISLMGLQPMIIAVSYAAGGYLAYYGVRSMAGLNIAELTTTGAACSAFGAVVVANTTSRERVSFFTKRQMPVVFILLGLLLINGLLNSRIPSAGWPAAARAVGLPFLVSGALLCVLLLQSAKVRISPRKKAKPAAMEQETAEPVEIPEPAPAAEGREEDDMQLMFSVPESAAVEEDQEMAAELDEAEPAVAEVAAEPAVQMTEAPVLDEDDELPQDNFIPLEIEKGTEPLLEDNPELMGLAAKVLESAPEPMEPAMVEPIVEQSAPEPMEPAMVEPVIEQSLPPELPEMEEETVDEQPASDLSNLLEGLPSFQEEAQPEIFPEPESVEIEEIPPQGEGKAESEDWLHGHLDLLNKLK